MRRHLTVLFVLGFLLTSLLGSPASASDRGQSVDTSATPASTSLTTAATYWQPYVWKTKVDRHAIVRSQWSKAIKRCIHTTRSFKFRYQWMAGAERQDPPLNYRNFAVRDPRIWVAFTKTGCRTSESVKGRVTKATVKQFITPTVYDYADCKLNPSVGVSIPWGVSLSVTPDCEDTKVKGAKYSTTNHNVSVVDQYNEGRKLYLEKSFGRVHPVCLKLNMATIVHLTVNGTAKSTNPNWATHRVCASRANSDY